MALFEKVLKGSASDAEAAQFRETWDKALRVTEPKGRTTGGEQTPETMASGGLAIGGERGPEKTIPIGQPSGGTLATEASASGGQAVEGGQALVRAMSNNESNRLETLAVQLKMFMWFVGLIVAGFIGFFTFGFYSISNAQTGLETRLESRIAVLETKLESRIAVLETKLEVKIDSLSDKVENLRMDVVRLQETVYGPLASRADQQQSSPSGSSSNGEPTVRGAPPVAGQAESRSE
jgi:hypothetical protein